MKRYIRTQQRPTTRLSVCQLEGRETPAASTFQAFGTAAGGLPVVDVLRPDSTELVRFQAFESAFTGGVRAAVGELDGDPNTLAVVAAAGPGGGPRVSVFRVDLTNNSVEQVATFFAFEPSFTGGVRVAVGNAEGTAGAQDIIVGADTGGGPRVRAFRLDGSTTTPVRDFFAFEPSFTGGVRVGAGEIDGDTADGDEIIVGAGPGGGPRVRVFRSDGAVLADYFAFQSGFLGGVNVGAESTGGTTDRVQVDGQTADFSQRNAALNQFAATSLAGSTTNTTGTTSTSATTTGTTTTGIDNTFGTGVMVTPVAGIGLTTGTSPVFSSGTVPIFSTGAGTVGIGNVGAGTLGFGTTDGGTTTTLGTAGLGTLGFGTAGFSTTGFGGTTGIGAVGTGLTTNGTMFPGLTTTTFGTDTLASGTLAQFGGPGVLTPFPTLVNPPFVLNSFLGTTATGTAF